jgi:preprotein translocase subunit YajC
MYDYLIAMTGGPAAAPVTAPSGGGGGGAAGIIQMAVLFAGIFVIFYLVLIRPQKKEENQRKEMLKALKKNDKVVTIGGIHGVVANVRDTDVTVKIDESGDVRVRFSRSAIARVLTKDEEEASKTE